MPVLSRSVCRYGPNVPASLSPTISTLAGLAAVGGPVDSGSVAAGSVDAVAAAESPGSAAPVEPSAAGCVTMPSGSVVVPLASAVLPSPPANAAARRTTATTITPSTTRAPMRRAR